MAKAIGSANRNQVTRAASRIYTGCLIIRDRGVCERRSTEYRSRVVASARGRALQALVSVSFRQTRRKLFFSLPLRGSRRRPRDHSFVRSLARVSASRARDISRRRLSLDSPYHAPLCSPRRLRNNDVFRILSYYRGMNVRARGLVNAPSSAAALDCPLPARAARAMPSGEVVR